MEAPSCKSLMVLSTFLILRLRDFDMSDDIIDIILRVYKLFISLIYKSKEKYGTYSLSLCSNAVCKELPAANKRQLIAHTQVKTT